MRQVNRDHYRTGARSHRDGISRRDVDELYPRMRDAHDLLSRRDEPKRGDRRTLVNNVLRPLAGAAAGAVATGLLTGRLNHWNFPGTPIPIGPTLALAGGVIDYFNLAGPFSSDFGAAGVGAFASWVNILSTGWGQQLRERAGEPLGPITAGIAGCIGCNCGPGPIVQPAAFRGPPPNALPFQRPTLPTEAEIAAMSHAMRTAA